MPPATAAGNSAFSRQPRGRVDLDRPVGAGAGRRLGVGEDADREECRRFGHRERAVEVAVVLRVGAAEVEPQRLARDRRRDPQDDVAAGLAGVVLEHVLGPVGAVGEGGEGGAGAALGVGEDLRHSLAQQGGSMALRELGEAALADPVGGLLGAEVGEALVRRPHPLGQPLEQAPLDPGRRDHDALVRERVREGRHPARRRAADVGVVGAAGGEAEQLAGDEDGRDQGHVRQVGAAAVGVVEDPGDARLVALAEHGGDRVGHRAEVDGDVLGLHHQLAGGVEQRGRAVVALLDVGRVSGADQRRAHLVAGGSQPADQHLQRDRVEPAHPVVPLSVTGGLSNRGFGVGV